MQVAGLREPYMHAVLLSDYEASSKRPKKWRGIESAPLAGKPEFDTNLSREEVAGLAIRHRMRMTNYAW